jgi:hypothetical protein
MMSVAEIIEQVKTLTPEEREELTKLLIDMKDAGYPPHSAGYQNCAAWVRKSGRGLMLTNMSINYAMSGMIVREDR